MFIQRRRGIHSYRRLEWIINETLHLQRLAHEELGFGTWHKADESIPITTRGEKLATVDMTEPEHPKLMAAKQRPGQQTSSSAKNSMEVTQEPASRPPAPLSYNSPPSSGTETLREETDPGASATTDSPPPTHHVHDHTPPNTHPTVSTINGGTEQGSVGGTDTLPLHSDSPISPISVPVTSAAPQQHQTAL